MSAAWIAERLAAGGEIIIDGANGSELERRGVPMDERAWCGPSVTTHSHVLKKIHKDYIAAGAEVIITNTFASSRQMLEPAGYGDQVAEMNTKAVEIAKMAVKESQAEQVAIAGSLSDASVQVAVAGSISDARADKRGLDSKWLQPQVLKSTYREQSELLVEAGADLLILEMMQEPEVAIPAIEEAMRTGVPVWVGLSCRSTNSSEELVMFDDTDRMFSETLEAVTSYDVQSIHIMHSPISDTTLGIQALKKQWDGAIGAYPNSGYFERPSWQFVDIATPEYFADHVAEWRNMGVQILGGCCGLGVEHIEAIGIS